MKAVSHKATFSQTVSHCPLRYATLASQFHKSSVSCKKLFSFQGCRPSQNLTPVVPATELLADYHVSGRAAKSTAVATCERTFRGFVEVWEMATYICMYI